ncbi:MAG: SsgA family sporulation/cell division regulator [Angustibacter sp.]
MLQPPLSVMDDLLVRLVAPGTDGLPLESTLRYSADDPFAVEATFRAGSDAISWVLGRDLLNDGLMGESGEGDVRVWPAIEDRTRVVMLELTSPDGRALLAADAASLEAFLQRTYEAVPLGYEGEHLNLDRTIARLMS